MQSKNKSACFGFESYLFTNLICFPVITVTKVQPVCIPRGMAGTWMPLTLEANHCPLHSPLQPRVHAPWGKPTPPGTAITHTHRGNCSSAISDYGAGCVCVSLGPPPPHLVTVAVALQLLLSLWPFTSCADAGRDQAWDSPHEATSLSKP